MAVAYYYDHMTKPKQAAYRSMLAGLTELTDSIQLPLLDAKELSEVFLLLRLDHPKLFWASGFPPLPGFSQSHYEAGISV